MPLKELAINGCYEARNFQVLGEIKTLELLLLPSTVYTLPEAETTAIAALRGHPKLRQLAADFMNRQGLTGVQAKELFWQAWDKAQWVRELGKQGMKFSANILEDGTWKIDLDDQPINDLSILKGAPISELSLSRTRFNDLRLLEGMPLARLWLWGTQVTDLSPLRGMALEALSLGGTKVSDLAPLHGMPLKRLTLTASKVSDLSPLRGMALEALRLDWTPVTDISVLLEMPLKVIQLPQGVTDVEAFSKMKTLEWVTIQNPQAQNIESLRSLPNLKRLSYTWDRKLDVPDRSAEEFWKEWDAQWLRDLRKRGLTVSAEILKDGTWKLVLTNQPISDLSILKGASISDLTLWRTRVKDLSPLEGMPLTGLNLDGLEVSDLSPLRGMALESLSIGSTKVNDLSPLRGMPLKNLRLGGTKVSDLSPLRGMPLTTLYLPSGVANVEPLAEMKTLVWVSIENPQAQNIEALRSLPNLKRIGFKHAASGGPDRTAEEFWKEWDAPWVRELRGQGLKFSADMLKDGTWRVNLADQPISDLSILKGAPISELTLTTTQVKDLRPLEGMPLTLLWLRGTEVTDLSPLRGMALEKLGIASTKVSDVSPLRGMPLKVFQLGGSQVSDLSPLRGMALEDLQFNQTQVSDVSFLRGMPLKTLHLPQGVTDVLALAEMKTLESVVIDNPQARNIESLRSLPNLKRIGYRRDWELEFAPDHTAEEFWKEWDAPWVRELRGQGLKFSAYTLKDGTWKLVLTNQPISDLSILKGAPISDLTLSKTQVKDLSPLAGMPLTVLHLDGEVIDLSPLRGMALETLHIGRTKVIDVSPLRGMPLEVLQLTETKVADLSPLLGLPLKRLHLDSCQNVTNLSVLIQIKTLESLMLPRNLTGVEELRKHPAIQRISSKWDTVKHRPDKTAAEFWAEWDAKKAATAKLQP
jgi:hypothetical protein